MVRVKFVVEVAALDAAGELITAQCLHARFQAGFGYDDVFVAQAHFFLERGNFTAVPDRFLE